nr:MAG TPA: hypothetical protein [Caudoviricetes sp.]
MRYQNSSTSPATWTGSRWRIREIIACASASSRAAGMA